MLPKSIFILLHAYFARQISCQVGERVSGLAKFLGSYEEFGGIVTNVTTNTHGCLVVLRNSNVGDLRTLCSGWTYLPIWISACGGQSGIVATWKEPEVLALVNMLQQRDESAMTSMMAL